MEQELAIKLQEDGIHYQTQVEVPIAIADFYFSLESRPLLMFVDGRLHHGTAQMEKDEELRLLLRKRGYRILELYYDSYSDKERPTIPRNPKQHWRNSSECDNSVMRRLSVESAPACLAPFPHPAAPVADFQVAKSRFFFSVR